MPRATPSYFQTHPLFYTLHLCSAGEEMSTGSVTWLLQNPSGSHSQCHTLHEVTFSTRGKKRKRKKKALGCFSSLSNKDFSIGYILLWVSDWFISYFKMFHSRALFLFQGKKLSDCWRKILLVILERLMHWLGQGKAAEDCSKSLITWECYLIVSFVWNSLINTLLWVNLTIDYQCSALKSDVAESMANTLCQYGDYLGKSHFLSTKFEIRQLLWSWNAWCG